MKASRARNRGRYTFQGGADGESGERRVMSSNYSRGRSHFGLAFELAYFIHVNKELAFFVAEDALDKLGSTLGRQEKKGGRRSYFVAS